VDHGSAREQLPVVVATIDTREEAIDASPDVDRIVHDLVNTMIPRSLTRRSDLVLRRR
jgi:PII-like signaling protein